ncbi:glycogen debranching enzyme N-terminal domain-containing protein [Phycisphaeraceae bacterium D3-23]
MLIKTTQGLTFAGDTDRFLQREWILTNAAGGFAMGTALNANTRRYHALLVAAAKPPVDRVVVLHHLVEQLTLHHGDASTTTLEFGPILFTDDQGKRVLAPDDTDMLRRFDADLAAVWSYEHAGLAFTRRLVVHDAEPACTVHYDLTGLNSVCESATLTLRPFITLRGFHDLTHQHDAAESYQCDASGDTLRVQHADRSASYRMPGGETSADPQWWTGVQYPIEARRGQGVGEDLYAPAVFKLRLPSQDDAAASFTATLGTSPAQPVAAPSVRMARVSKIGQTLSNAITPGMQGNKLDSLGREIIALAGAADDFIVKRSVGNKNLSTVIAGYPWFADWGRDTFIALPGLLLCTGRHGEARDTLEAFANAIRDGLVPNRFDDDDPTIAHYNTVDASLWFVHSALEYLETTGDSDAWNRWLAQACVDVVEGYRRGTRADAHDGRAHLDIAMQDDGLIAAGNENSQLTWMDAAAPGPDGKVHVFTPRPGKCIEINALWYSALVRLSGLLPKGLREERKRYADLAPRVLASFSAVFWNKAAAKRGYLIDHVVPDSRGRWTDDAALRPNMMIACALNHSPVDPAHREASIAAVKAKLLTPVGLRTLPQDDPDYHPRYEGDAFTRDGAYHRGIVWPWLIGPYAQAVLQAGGFGDDAKREARAAIAPLLERLTTTQHPGMLGQLHEIHEPEPPFAPRGCPAQAWSVAEVLRVWCLLNQDV